MTRFAPLVLLASLLGCASPSPETDEPEPVVVEDVIDLSEAAPPPAVPEVYEAAPSDAERCAATAEALPKRPGLHLAEASRELRADWPGLATPEGDAVCIGRTVLVLGPDNVVSAEASTDAAGYPTVLVRMGPAAAEAFAAHTGANVRKPLAVLLDGRLLLAPTIQERIAGGLLQISGLASEAAARDLAQVLAP